jgi:prophage antirepressor-like protein
MDHEVSEMFESVTVRKVYHSGEWWISAIDATSAMGYSNPQREAKLLIQRNKERFEGYSTRIKLIHVENGINKKRDVVMLNIKGVIALCMLSNKPKAIPFQRWADNILAEHVEAASKIRAGKYGEITDKTITCRKMETSEWKRHGIEAPADYRELTLYEYELLGIKNKRKGEMAGDELIELTLSNLSNTVRLKAKQNKIFKNGIQSEMKETAKYIESIKQIG